MSTEMVRAVAREEYRELVYRTAELISGGLAPDAFFSRACELARGFFRNVEISIVLHGASVERGGTGDRTYASTGFAAVAADDAVALSVPLRVGSDVVGEIRSVASDGRPFAPDTFAALEKWGLLLGVRAQEMHLSAANARLEVLVGIDGLTGISNRRAFSERLIEAGIAAVATGAPLAVAMLDIDFFKAYNDNYGHVAGDACLRQIAQTLAQNLRPDDALGRYGGEEFVVLFGSSGLDEATRAAERLRECVSALGIPHVGSRVGRVTVSVGVARRNVLADDDASRVLREADEALYAAKERGRDRVVSGSYVSKAATALPQYGVRTNLPQPASSFCARDVEVARVREKLAQSRLVTLVGFGGVGKTRLAIEVASDYVGTQRDGVWFVDLSGTADPALLVGIVATALDVRDAEAARSTHALIERVRMRQLLLVLDNCEHLRDACASFASELVRAAPNVRILATSRQPLDVLEESIATLGPLSLPPSGTCDPQTALGFGAIALFVERANLARPFTLDDANVAYVIDICRRLDGIALAIELAAARLKVLDVRHLRGRLDRRFAVLARRDGAIVPRQRTLESLIDWSYQLLTLAERDLFARLAVFAGAFTFEAAAAICGARSTDVGGDEAIASGLDALVDKSLLTVDVRRGGARTFRFFESIRSYARDRATATGAMAVLERRHLRYFVETAVRARAARSSPSWREAIAPLGNAIDDVRAALETSLRRGVEPALGMCLAASLGDFWIENGYMREGRMWIARAREMAGPADAALGARLVAVALELAPTFGDREAEADASALHAFAVAHDDLEIMAQARYHLGKSGFLLGDFEAAFDHLSEARRLCVLAKDRLGAADATSLLAATEYIRKSDDSARRHNDACVREYRELNRSRRSVQPLGNAAEAAFVRGEIAEAVAVAKRALSIAERYRDRAATAWLLANLGAYHVALHESDAATSYVRDAMILALDVDDAWLFANCCETLAHVACETGDALAAARLLGFAEQRLEDLRLPRQPAEFERLAVLDRRLRSSIGIASFDLAFAAGRTLTQDALLAEIAVRDVA